MSQTMVKPTPKAKRALREITASQLEMVDRLSKNSPPSGSNSWVAAVNGERQKYRKQLVEELRAFDTN
jgi:hypothetical protein